MTRVPQSFVQIDVLIHPDALEGVSEVLLALGAKGVADAGTASQRRVTAYFPADGRDEERFRGLEARLAQLREMGLHVGVGFISVREVAEQEWGDIWRVHFHAQRISPNLIIVPSWEQYRPRPDEHVIVLDPGAAFGTGGHATTRLCLRALTQHLRPGARVADIGTGSGILAVGAVLLGASHVLATDSDGAVLEIAAYNAARNHVDDRIEIIETDLIPRDRGPFDLVLCNILAPEVVRLAADLPQLLAPGGVVIVSGFILASIPDVTAAMEQAGLAVLAKPEEGEWAAVVAQAPGGEEAT